MYQLTSCSTTDLDKKFFEQTGIKYLNFTYTIDGVEYPDDLGERISHEEFYNLMKNGALPTTSQVNVDTYLQLFKPILENGEDILHLCFSSGLSGTINSALKAKDILLKEFPNRTIYIVDSLAASSGFGLLLSLAYEKKQAGMDIVELKDWVEANKLNINHLIISTDLSHYRRGGRISGASAAIGGLLNICPFIEMNSEGKLIQRDKLRGKKRALNFLVEKMLNTADNGKDYNNLCYISHSSSEDLANKLKELVEETFPNLKSKVKIYNIGMVIGSHTGPGTVTLFYKGQERTK